MPFISPMLAAPLPDNFAPFPGAWIAEEKFDGHRIILEVTDVAPNLFHRKTVRAWSRDGLDRLLPAHLVDAAQNLPAGVFDGELLVPGRRSYGVTRLDLSTQLVYKVFDILEVSGRSATHLTWMERRHLLDAALVHRPAGIEASECRPVETSASITLFAEEVWARDGEGLILKDIRSAYEPGKRRKTWIKIKAVRHASLEVTGFRAGRLGACSITCLRDEEGVETTVKTKDTATRTLIEVDPGRYIGRRLVIEYQERTPDGGYRHGMWDRWEDE
jgi:bifunctional non-homologous end joining protein LigD